MHNLDLACPTHVLHAAKVNWFVPRPQSRLISPARPGRGSGVQSVAWVIHPMRRGFPRFRILGIASVDRSNRESDGPILRCKQLTLT